MQALSQFIVRRAGLITILGTLVSLVAGYYSVLLYMNLKTDILELLPTDSRSVLDLHEVTGRLESIDNLAVLVFSSNTKASERFVTDLAQKLERVPRDVISSVEYKIDQELRFFKERQALYMELEDLIKIRNYLKARIDYEKELYNPLNIFRGVDIPEPKLDFLALRKKYESRTSTFDKMPGGYYATPDGSIRAVLANLPGKGIQAQKALQKAVTDAIQELKPESYSEDIKIKYTGGVEDSIEEQDALVEDLEVSTVICTVMVILGMLVFYRSWRATWALMISLFMGTAWTFGVSYFVVGYLNANSAFLGSIVIGNGINFGIIYLARYLEERRKNHSVLVSTEISISQTATSTWTAALAAGLSYGSLMLTGFRGFKQFGVIGLIGMVLCWISAYTMLPALLTVFDTKKALTQGPRPTGVVMTLIARLIGRIPYWVWGISVVATVGSVVALTRLDRHILETDLNKLRNRDSLEFGSAYLTRYIDEIFQRYLSPIVILPDSRTDARKIAQDLRELKASQGDQSFIGSVQTLDDFIPSHQAEKIAVLHEIKRILPPKIVRRLSEEDQNRIQFLLNAPAFRPITQHDLPPLVIQKFTEKNGAIGKMVLVEPPLKNELADGQNLIRFIDELRNTADHVKPGTPVAGQLVISSDMIRAISKDGPRATFTAFIAVVVLVIALFRNWVSIALVLSSLLLGVLWLAGIIIGFNLKVNFLNFIALPITFGIGVDYGVNIFQRYREIRKNGSILEVIKTTGSAVGLCSFSTIVGYCSLLIARNRGFVSFGLLAVLGEVTCIAAAIFSIPAYLTLRARRNGQR